MKLFADQVQESIKLAMEYATFDEKHKPTEQDIEKADRKILEAKKEFDEAKVMKKDKVAEFFRKLEVAEIERRQLSQSYLDAKDKLGARLRAITTPAILGFSEELMGEFRRLETRKVFSVIEDRQDAEGNRIFSCSHNFFVVHSVQQSILDTISKLKEMDLRSLPEIRDVYDAMVTGIPEKFEFETSQGGEEFRSWIDNNRPHEVRPGEIKEIWLETAKLEADMQKKYEDWKKEKNEKVVEELVKKHHAPIEINMVDK